MRPTLFVTSFLIFLMAVFVYIAISIGFAAAHEEWPKATFLAVAELVVIEIIKFFD